jgi:hypothetical protein
MYKHRGKLMEPDHISVRLPILVRGLSERLRMALMSAFRLGLAAGRGLTVEVFLVSLYKSFPMEVAPFFYNAQPLERLAQELSLISLSAHEIAPAISLGDPAKMLLSKIDEPLVKLLSQTAKRASDPGKEPADVAEFMTVLGHDAETLTVLQNERGLMFRPRPS